MRSNPSLHRASIPVSDLHLSSTIPSSPSSRLAVINTRAQHSSVGARHYFARTALFSAVASVLVGFGMASASAAETAPRKEMAENPTATNTQTKVQSNSQNNVTQDDSEDILIDFDSEADLDATLEALRLRRDFEQGEIDKSVLDEFSEQRKQDKESRASDSNSSMRDNTGNGAESDTISANDNSTTNSAANDNNNTNDNEIDLSQTNNEDFDSDAELQRQATAIQQQGYQMMTPEQIDRELAALDAENDSFMESFNNGDTDGLGGIFDAGFSSDQNSSNSNNLESRFDNFDNNEGFNAPVARLDSQQLPLGLDPKIDSAALPAPNNLETLNRAQSVEEQAQTAEIMARPIEVSDSVSSGRVDDGADITEQNNPEQVLTQQDNRSVTGADDTIAEAQIEASDGEVTVAQNGDQSGDLNPDDYLPDYQAEDNADAVTEGVIQANKSKPLARNEGGIVKRLYNRLFNGGVAALPRVETTVYLQQEAASGSNNATSATPRLIKADEDIQPINNIKAAIDDTTVQSVTDFTAALPRLRV